MAFSCVVDIWGRGLTTVGDRFVLDGREAAPGEMVLAGLNPDLGTVEEIRVRIDGAGRGDAASCGCAPGRPVRSRVP